MNKPTKHKGIFGWFNYEGTYDMIFESLKEGGTFVEVGVFEGKSLCYMGELAMLNNKDVTLHGVDIFAGVDHWDNKYGADKPGLGLYESAKANLAQAGVNAHLHKLSSKEAAAIFPNNLEAVYIDAAHDYENVKLDIRLWLPKIKNGGILAGHDYGSSWPGVILAVDEVLSNYKVHKNPAESTWWIYKEGE